MNKTENEANLAETVRLYEVEKLSIDQLAERLMIRRLAVIRRLRKAGIKRERWWGFKTLDRELLVKLYVTDKLSVFDVAKLLSVDSTVVLHEMERFGIDRRPKYSRQLMALDRDRLVQLYVNERKSMAAIAKILHVSKPTVLREMKRHLIERRRSRRSVDDGIAETVRLYEAEQLSMKQIAKQLNLTRHAIQHRLKKAGVPIRPKKRDVLKTLDRGDLERLYVDQKLPIYIVEKLLHTSKKVINRELERYSIEKGRRSSGPWKSTPLVDLKVGESAVMIHATKKKYDFLYKLALRRNMKVSVKRVDANHVRVTRTK